MRFVFVHGWGFDASFWSPLIEELSNPDHFCVDLGFLGQAKTHSVFMDTPYIAVGHSFGVQWLLQNCSHNPWQALISINGIARFTKSDEFPQGTDPRILRRMIAGFEKRPQEVWVDFLKMCGLENPESKNLDTGPLLDSLHALRDGDEREALAGCKVPVLALTGGGDMLASPAYSDATFATPHTVLVKPDGNHILPLSDPQWCAQRIREFLPLVGLSA